MERAIYTYMKKVIRKMTYRLFCLLLGLLLCAGLTGCAVRMHVSTNDRDTLIENAMLRGENAETEAVTLPEWSSGDELPRVDGTYRIVVDPGHGFDDGGTGPYYLGDKLEKDVVLPISLQLVTYLEEMGFEVFLTHNGEWFPKSSADNGNNIFDPMERTAYANTLKADYFVSIHCNSYEQDETVNGIRLYYCDNPYSGQKGAAGAVQKMTDEINRQLIPDKEAVTVAKNMNEAYYVTKYMNTTALLVEIGFVTNEGDAENMLDEEWGKALAKAMADGIYKHFHQGDPQPAGAGN